jgi:hypothetical protein
VKAAHSSYPMKLAVLTGTEEDTPCIKYNIFSVFLLPICECPRQEIFAVRMNIAICRNQNFKEGIIHITKNV